MEKQNRRAEIGSKLSQLGARRTGTVLGHCHTSKEKMADSDCTLPVNYRSFDWPAQMRFRCHIFLSHFGIFHEFSWIHMELYTRQNRF
jgi:hypothetical protein